MLLNLGTRYFNLEESKYFIFFKLHKQKTIFILNFSFNVKTKKQNRYSASRLLRNYYNYLKEELRNFYPLTAIVSEYEYWSKFYMQLLFTPMAHDNSYLSLVRIRKSIRDAKYVPLPNKWRYLWGSKNWVCEPVIHKISTFQ